MNANAIREWWEPNFFYGELRIYVRGWEMRSGVADRLCDDFLFMSTNKHIPLTWLLKYTYTYISISWRHFFGDLHFFREVNIDLTDIWRNNGYAGRITRDLEAGAENLSHVRVRDRVHEINGFIVVDWRLRRLYCENTIDKIGTAKAGM